MGLLKNIEWKDNSSNTIVYKVDMKNDYISRGSVLTVRDGQVAIFAAKGKMADVFEPGYYKLGTSSVPIITKLMSWKYGFENIFRNDVYFVSTKQFTNQKWGTINPIMIRDKDYGAVRVKGFGTYAFRVKDAFVFMTELAGSKSAFTTEEINEYLRSIVLSDLTDTIGESNLPILDLAGNLKELNKRVTENLADDFNAMGLELTKFTLESFTLPEELEKALDENTSMSMRRNTLDVQMRLAQAEALKEAAKNPGMAGSMMGAGIGAGMGFGMGQMFGDMSREMNKPKIQCPECGTEVKPGAKFCPECGKKLGGSFCPKCGEEVKPGAKFCPECGEKI
jgi:membrane protease subunit (stomatin/prohibitin family)